MHLTARLAALVTVVAAFRIKSPKQRTQRARGQPGQVDGLYTYGAPASASPGLKNLRGDNPCFPGYRAVGVNSVLRTMDSIPWVARTVGFEHSWGDVMLLDVSNNVSSTIPCSEEALAEPSHFFKLFSLHLSYGNSNWEGWSSFDVAAHTIGMGMQWLQIQSFAKSAADGIGWGLVHSAYAFGELTGGGLQVQHFVQQPETLECALTFQATLSLGDVITDLKFFPKPFCGLPNQVHGGFRNHLRRMISSDDWQNNIRPYLSSCSKVYAMGTSLGGATAELFSACANFAPSAKNDPDGDFAQIGWTKGTPRKLQYV